MIGIEEFDKVQLRVGTVTAVSINKKARKPDAAHCSPNHTLL